MNVVAGVLAVVYGLVHAVPGIAMLNAADADRGSGEPGAIPKPARLAWVGLSVLAGVSGVLLALDANPITVAFVALAMLGVGALSVANGAWMKGRPTPAHHLVRGLIVGLTIVMAVASI